MGFRHLRCSGMVCNMIAGLQVVKLVLFVFQEISMALVK